MSNDVTEMPEEDRHSIAPISQRPASAPGHWVLARVPEEVLRPVELTLPDAL